MLRDKDIPNDMYAKLFAQVAQSSLTQNETIEVRGVFFMLLAIADREGVVMGTDAAIARIINVAVELFRAALERLMAPDPESQSEKEDGRRVIRLKNAVGLLVVNYQKYQGIRNDEQRRAYNRQRQAECRARKKAEREALASENAGGSEEAQPGAENRSPGEPGGKTPHPDSESGSSAAPAKPTEKKTLGTGGRRNRPESIEECVEQGKLLCIPELVCRKFYLHHDARAVDGMNGEIIWMTGGENNQVPVGNWVTLLKSWAENERGGGPGGRRRFAEIKKDAANVVCPTAPAIDVSKFKVTKPTNERREPQPAAL